MVEVELLMVSVSWSGTRETRVSPWKEEEWVAVHRDSGITVEEGGVRWHSRGRMSRCHNG